MKTYSKETKTDALALADEIGVVETGKKLNISCKTLYGWRKAAQGASKPGDKEPIEAKIKRLEKEIDELRRANEILKKAMGFLAR